MPSTVLIWGSRVQVALAAPGILMRPCEGQRLGRGSQGLYRASVPTGSAGPGLNQSGEAGEESSPIIRAKLVRRAWAKRVITKCQDRVYSPATGYLTDQPVLAAVPDLLDQDPRRMP